MKKIGILTSLEANHGACIFNASLNKLIGDLDVQNEVKFLDFLNPHYRTRELLRALKFNKNIPFYNLNRHLTLDQETKMLTIEKVVNLYSLSGLIDELNRRSFDTLIVGKVIWDISKDSLFGFPSIYWLSEKIKAKKIAYAASGHRTDLEKFSQNKKRVFELLSSYRLIGVRDKNTQLMMAEAGVDKVVPVVRITDPAFLFVQKPVDVNDLLDKYKIASNRPILGLLYYGKQNISEKICAHFHQMGYQIINFNMFNPFADVNIGHLVGIDEWVELIKQLDFCITDRFHVSVFCLRESIPFTAIEPYQPKSLLNSKIFSLLESFNVQEGLYQNEYDENFNIDRFISNCDEIQLSWNDKYAAEIRKNLQINNLQQEDFLEKVDQIIRE